MMMATTMIQIVAAGGGLTIDLEKQTLLSDTMMQIAAAAAHSGAKVTFKVGKSIFLADTMFRIAATGRGNVIFDLS